MRARTVAPQVSVAAPAPATTAAAATCARPRRVSASEPIAPIQSAGYHSGHPPGASHRIGAKTPARVANNGATLDGTPRRGPSAARPAAAPASKIDTPARASASCHAIHKPKPAPTAGSAIPRARSRSRNGPPDATRITTATAIHRDGFWNDVRSTSNNTARASAVVISSAATFDVSGPPIAAK